MRVTMSSVIKKLLLLFLVCAGLYYAKAFLMPITIGGVIATLLLPFCRWMEKKNIQRGLAVLICSVIIFMIIGFVGFLIGWQISTLVDDFVLIKQKVLEKIVFIQEFIFNHLGIAIEKQSQILKTEQPTVTKIMQVLVGSLKYLIINFVLILAYVFLLLYYRSHIKQFILKLTPPDEKKSIEHIIYSTTSVTQHYLLGLAKMIALLWLMYSIGFGSVGVHNFIFFAILCGLLEIIPFIGNITGTLLTLMVAGINGADATVLVGIVVVYSSVQLIQGWILEPLILGPQVKINPLFTIIALVLGEILWGIPGIILAIPITAMIKIACDNIDPLKPFGFLIGEITLKQPRKSLLTKIKGLFK